MEHFVEPMGTKHASPGCARGVKFEFQVFLTQTRLECLRKAHTCKLSFSETKAKQAIRLSVIQKLTEFRTPITLIASFS